MKSSVIIKGNKYGFQIVLNPTLPFEELLREVGDKFKKSTHFFDLKKPIAVSFTGRELTSGEQNLLVDTIAENSGLNISCVIDGAKVYETQFAKVLSELKEEEKKEEHKTEESFPENRLGKNGQFLSWNIAFRSEDRSRWKYSNSWRYQSRRTDYCGGQCCGVRMSERNSTCRISG